MYVDYHTKRQVNIKMRKFTMFIPAVSVLCTYQCKADGGEGVERRLGIGTPRQNAMRMSIKFDIRSAFYFRSSI